MQHRFKGEIFEVIDNDKIVLKDTPEQYPKVLYFTAKWCGPCQRITPIYKALAENNPIGMVSKKEQALR